MLANIGRISHEKPRILTIRNKLTSFINQFYSHFKRTDRLKWCGVYLSGLITEGERKSIEPMANRIRSGNVQALQQFVNQSPWSFESVQEKLREIFLTKLKPNQGILILDDTTLPKKGKNSVGVAPQYCGALGKVANCQSIVSWHFANNNLHLPLIAELYLPQSWIEDKERLLKSGVPARRFHFLKKWQVALSLFDKIKDELPFKAVVCDAGYGEVPEFLAGLDKKGVHYVAQIPERMSFWPEELQVAFPENLPRKVGRPNKHPKSLSPQLKPVQVQKLLPDLIEKHLFTHVKINLKYKKHTDILAVKLRQAITRSWVCLGPSRWLIIEKFHDGYKYYVSNLPDKTSLAEMAKIIHSRWKIEQGYQRLKEELGLDHFEGRSWLGLHHHITLCFMAYYFLISLKETCKKK